MTERLMLAMEAKINELRAELTEARAEADRFLKLEKQIAWERDPEGRAPDVPVLQPRYDALKARATTAEAALTACEAERDIAVSVRSAAQQAMHTAEANLLAMRKERDELDALLERALSSLRSFDTPLADHIANIRAYTGDKSDGASS